MKVLIVEPMQPCRVQEIPNTPEAMEQIVGGRLESFSYQREAIISNEEGKLLDLPRNRPLYDNGGTPIDMLRGTFFVAGIDGEHLVSLTDEQIQRYKALYDNMAERPDFQVEIAPESALSYFAIGCQISFRITRDDQQGGTLEDEFVHHVTEVFNQDKALSENLVGDLNFSFHDDCAEVEYSFADRTTEESLAEAFSEQCVRKVQAKLEEYGYKIEKIDCYAERLVDDLPQVETPPKKQETQKKKGHHHER